MKNFKLNRKGGSEVLKNIVADEIRALGRKVAAAAGDEADLSIRTTDRAVASVAIPAAQQAKDGRLTRAASAAGLEVKPR